MPQKHPHFMQYILILLYDFQQYMYVSYIVVVSCNLSPNVHWPYVELLTSLALYKLRTMKITRHS